MSDATKPPIVLVVDDKVNMLRLLEKVLRHDATLRTADSGGAALAILDKESIDVVLCDLRLPDIDGLEVLKQCQRVRPHAQFILMTAYASIGTAVEALRLGAYDYLTKPLDPDAARLVVLRAIGRRTATSDSDGAVPATGAMLPGMVARSAAMADLAELVRRFANSNATTLLLGETGTGKERIARAIHELSPRAGQRFIAVNCAAIPAELLESELFGYAKGSFTGALKDRQGLFEEANHGTLFLDEIGDMRPSLQAKLTRVLEQRAVRRVGESVERAVDVRIIAATHQDIESMVARGGFREDLWYRLNVALVRIPPLRHRKEDIEPLAAHFLREGAAVAGRGFQGFSEGAMDTLNAYDWPGNVRQLRAAVERASVVARGTHIQASDLPPEVAESTRGGALDSDITELSWSDAMKRGQTTVAQHYLRSVLSEAGGRVADAAARAGVERESFYRLMRRYGVDQDGKLTYLESDPPDSSRKQG